MKNKEKQRNIRKNKKRQSTHKDKSGKLRSMRPVRRVPGRGRGLPRPPHPLGKKRYERPPPYKVIQKDNNNHLTHGPSRFFPTRSSSRRRLHPPPRGGNLWSQEFPVLRIPSYLALCCEDTTSWNHGRPGTHHERQWIASCIHQLRGFIHVCHAHTPYSLNSLFRAIFK